MPKRPLLARHCPLLCCGLAAALLPLAGHAGRAQVGADMVTWATTDLDNASASGQRWRDGVLQQTLRQDATPDNDSVRIGLRVDSGPRNTTARAEVQAQAQLRGTGEAFSGTGRVASDVAAGTLALQWHSSRAQDPGTPRMGDARGYPFAELWESFEVLYPIGRSQPVEVTLALQLGGQIAGSSLAGPAPGVEAYLSLGGVDTGEAHAWLDPVWRSETSVAGTVISFSGPLRSLGCSVARGVCSGVASLYAALDLRARLPGAPADAWQVAAAPVDLAFSGQLSLRVSDGVTLVRGDGADPLPAVAWAQVSSVPEPAPTAMLLVGLALVGWRRLRQRRATLAGNTMARATLARATLGLGALVLGALWPAVGMAQTWQLAANLNATAVMFLPDPREDHVDALDLNLLNQPEARQLQTRDTFAEVSNGGWAQTRFAGRVGLLKAYAASSYPSCCTIDGRTVTIGYGNGTVVGSFYDTVAVAGAGLAPGTPVQYRVDVDISGSLSSPRFELGGHLSVYGLAEVRLRDMTTFREVALSWDAARQDTGRYSLTLDTVVGHALGLSGRLALGASVDAYARTARYAEADFYSTASFQLAPSVAGLNTVGASGHDFLAPVPEPATRAALLLGLAALGAWARLRRSGLPAC